MSKICTAIYEAGILRPLEYLDLKEHEKVKIMITSDSRWAPRT